MTEKLKLDWADAEVSDATLTVGLSATPPKTWGQAFDHACGLLHSGDESITIHAKRATIEVTPVHTGDEERLHGLLEGAVLEANGSLVDEDELYDRPSAAEEAKTDETREADSPEAELAGRCRAFGEPSADAGQDRPSAG